MNGYNGIQNPNSTTSEFNAQSFLIWSILSKISTSMLVQVKSVTNSGGVAAVGTVDIQPLVNQVNGANQAKPHAMIYGCPYFRLQGGADAIILDPKVGDIGIAIFPDRDSSSVIANKASIIANGGTVNPGSGRMFDMSDGIYIGGILNGVPTQYIEFAAGGITVTSPSAVTIKAPAIALENAGSLLKKLVNETFLTLYDAHTHSGVTTGGGVTGAPVIPSVSTNKTSVTQAE